MRIKDGTMFAMGVGVLCAPALGALAAEFVPDWLVISLAMAVVAACGVFLIWVAVER